MEKIKVVIAIDSLKGSLSSVEAGNCIRVGILRAIPDADVLVSPMADGGEGTVEALISGMGGTLQRVLVSGPLGDPVGCEYGIIEDGKTAVIEMAGAAGITLVPAAQRNPLDTTTYGVGQVIRSAIEKAAGDFLSGSEGARPMTAGSACCRLWDIVLRIKRAIRYPLERKD